MQRGLLILIITFYVLSLQAQPSPAQSERKTQDPNPQARYVGKYEMDGHVIQFALQNGRLVLVVPGAPIQDLNTAGKINFNPRFLRMSSLFLPKKTVRLWK